MSESTPKPQLHVSMLNTLARCGIQFQRRYGHRFGVWHEEEIRPPSVALAVGSSVHKGVEANLRSKMENKEFLSAQELSSIVSDQIDGFWSGGMFFSDDDAKRVQEIYGEAKDLAISLAVLHHEQIAPQITPLALEEKFVINLDGYPIDLSGTKDVRTADSIRDTKTAKLRAICKPSHRIHCPFQRTCDLKYMCTQCGCGDPCNACKGSGKDRREYGI